MKTIVKFESRQDWAALQSQFWQKDFDFWTRYDQLRAREKAYFKQAQYIAEAMGYRPDQPEY